MKPKQPVLELYKNRGETPLECLDRFKIDNPEYKNEKVTYAGRLDPLAHGLLLVLVGEECKNKEKYLSLDKEYEIDILFGFSTDTYDTLGLVTDCLCEEQGDAANQVEYDTESGLPRYARKDIQNVIQTFIGRFSQKYPAYSSKYWNSARSGELDSDEIESKEVEIKNIELLGERTISKKDLEKYIKESIDLVKGDFRQKEILQKWESVFQGIIRQNRRMDDNRGYKILSIKVNCTSGTYMRSLANAIGEKMGIPALALNIRRIKVGNYGV